jgi:hypothetical protein
MKKNKIIYVYSTHLSEEHDQKYEKHVKLTAGKVNIEIHRIVNQNQYSLPQVYNRAIADYNEDGAIFVFAHNDIYYDTRNWGKLLLNHFNSNNYQILGVAGTTHIPKSGMWWEDKTKMVGVVNHESDGKKWTSLYSDSFDKIRDVVTVDGLFMAVDADEIVHGFDMDFGKFHFYDISFCLPNYLDGCNIGVIKNIRITHKSVGQTNMEWEQNRQQFSKKFADELPIKHVPNVEDGEKLNICICCLSFAGLTGSEMSTFELAREHRKNGHQVTIIANQVGQPLIGKAEKLGIKVTDLAHAPNYIPQHNRSLVFHRNEADFDILHLQHLPVAKNVVNMYPNTPAVMHVRSEVIPNLEEPLIHPMIKKYISIRPPITDFIQTFGVKREQIVEIPNPFDYTRFNTNYKVTPKAKKAVLFVGTCDYLRKAMLFDQARKTSEIDWELWIVGEDSMGYIKDLKMMGSHVIYHGVRQDVEVFTKKCDQTTGIMLGRTTIEGFMCGKEGWIYNVDKEGKILEEPKLHPVPDDVDKYRADNSANLVMNLYQSILGDV